MLDEAPALSATISQDAKGEAKMKKLLGEIITWLILAGGATLLSFLILRQLAAL